MKPTLVVLSAGMGSRYGGIKQIEKVGPGGESLIDYSIYNAIKAGFGKIVLVVREAIEAQVKEFFANKVSKEVELIYINQELSDIPKEVKHIINIPSSRDKPWGTGHALWVCRDVVKEPFVMINGDDYYAFEALQTAAEFLKAVDPQSNNYALVGYKLKETLSTHGSVSRGVCQVKGEQVSHLEEHTKIWVEGNTIVSDYEGNLVHLTGEEAVSMNLFAFTPAFLQQLHGGFIQFLKKHHSEVKAEFLCPAFLGDLLFKREAQCKLLPTDAHWFGITYKEDTPKVRELLEKLHTDGRYPQKLF